MQVPDPATIKRRSATKKPGTQVPDGVVGTLGCGRVGRGLFLYAKELAIQHPFGSHIVMRVLATLRGPGPA
jgi:hypothetical protein